MLWNLIYSLFGVKWVMHSSIRRNLLGWHSSSWVKNGRKRGGLPLYAYCGLFGMKELEELSMTSSDSTKQLNLFSYILL